MEEIEDYTKQVEKARYTKLGNKALKILNELMCLNQIYNPTEDESYWIESQTNELNNLIKYMDVIVKNGIILNKK